MPDQDATEHTMPSKETRAAEAEQARMPAQGGPEPTEAEAKAADEVDLDPNVAEHEREMAERGADQEGEGRLP